MFPENALFGIGQTFPFLETSSAEETIAPLLCEINALCCKLFPVWGHTGGVLPAFRVVKCYLSGGTDPAALTPTRPRCFLVDPSI